MNYVSLVVNMQIINMPLISRQSKIHFYAIAKIYGTKTLLMKIKKFVMKKLEMNVPLKISMRIILFIILKNALIVLIIVLIILLSLIIYVMTNVPLLLWKEQMENIIANVIRVIYGLSMKNMEIYIINVD